jgi:TolB-like protein
MVKAQQVADELNVQYVLEGSIQRAGDRVRIRAQLIDGATDHHLWAESAKEQNREIAITSANRN